MTSFEFIHPASSPLAKKRWPLSPIDVYAFRWLIQGTWIFKAALDLHSLKQGLSKLLDAYPLLSGRVVRGREIEYREGGIPFTIESNENITVDDFRAESRDVRRFGDRRSITKIKLGLEPLMTVKLTKLRDGWVVAACCSHASMDGSGFYSMMRNWGRATKGQPFPWPTLDRPAGSLDALHSKAEVTRRAQKAGWRKLSLLSGALLSLTAALNVSERVFVTHFSPEALVRCKKISIEESGSPQLSSNTAAVAHIAKCLVTLLDLKRESFFSISSIVDQRERVESIPESFARNAASFVVTEAIPVSATRGEIAGCIHRRLAPMLTKPAEFENYAALMADVAHSGLPYSPLPIAKMLRRRPSHFYTNSFQKMPIYDLEFGGKFGLARPVRVIPHDLADAILVWPAPPSIGGIEIFFSGPLARVVRVLNDADPWWSQLRCFDPLNENR